MFVWRGPPRPGESTEEFNVFHLRPIAVSQSELFSYAEFLVKFPNRNFFSGKKFSRITSPSMPCSGSVRSTADASKIFSREIAGYIKGHVGINRDGCGEIRTAFGDWKLSAPAGVVRPRRLPPVRAFPSTDLSAFFRGGPAEKCSGSDNPKTIRDPNVKGPSRTRILIIRSSR